LTEDWVRVISSPPSSTCSSPPGTTERYLPPSRPLLTIAAELSDGSSMPSRTLNVTSAR
jgi:hypothetical protein